MIIHVKNKNTFIIDDFKFTCCVGKNGLSSNKREGDFSTPKGLFKIKKLYFRKDRVGIPNSTIIKKKITTSSHQSGDYSLQTLKILKKIGIILSFRSNIKIDKKFIGTKYQNLTIPREDHINLLK